MAPICHLDLKGAKCRGRQKSGIAERDLVGGFLVGSVISLLQQGYYQAQRRDGEISVASLLDSLRGCGAHVFHDVPLEVGNIDHIVLSTTGFYAVETKARSKPWGPRTEISFEGNHIFVGGFQPDRDPLDQVQRNARFLRALLADRAKKQ